MLLKIVIYLTRGHGTSQSLNVWRVEFGPITDKMQKLQKNPTLCKEICRHSKSNGIKLHKVQESAGSAVGDKYPSGRTVAIQGVTGQTKVNHM